MHEQLIDKVISMSNHLRIKATGVENEACRWFDCTGAEDAKKLKPAHRREWKKRMAIVRQMDKAATELERLFLLL